MFFPSGENFGKLSTPDGELSLKAVPPSFGATQRSFAYVKTIWSFDTSGNLKSPASIWANKDVVAIRQLSEEASFLITEYFLLAELTKIIRKANVEMVEWYNPWF